MSNFDEMRAGKYGLTIETGTDAHTGKWGMIYCTAQTNFAVLTMPGNDGDAGTGFNWPAGSVIYGEITAFTLTSGGPVIAYKYGPGV